MFSNFFDHDKGRRSANRSYGWRPQLPDHRDRKFTLHLKLLAPGAPTGLLPPSVDLRPGMPPVYDQGNLGSCTANALAAAIQFDEKKESLQVEGTPSRLFIYYNERVMEGTIRSDAGAALRDGIKSLAQVGYCQESEWPYVETRFRKRPPANLYAEAKVHEATNYGSVNQNETEMKACLASGYPFVLGITVYESFESDAVAQSGVVPMPDPSEQCMGGHAVICCGYDDIKSLFLVRNSWGPDWGQGGYFQIPYAYLTNPDLATDFWVVKVCS